MVSPNRSPDESLDQYFDRLRDKSDREDLVMFINACFAATKQNDFYSDHYQQSVSIHFLHDYVRTNFRRLYAQALAAGINHFNKALIVFNLLNAGALENAAERKEEGELIWATLKSLPANRVFGLLRRLQQHRVNNRRTRAIIKRYLKWRREPEFDAIKYRNKVRAAVAHAHVKLPGEIGAFLFRMKKQRRFARHLLDQYRKAHYSAAAIYDLPFTIAESLAVKHGVPRDVFLQKIQHKMTAAEKLRFQTSSQRSTGRSTGQSVEFDLARAPLTKLILYILSLPIETRRDRADEFDAAVRAAAARTCRHSPLKLGRVAAVLDCSLSSAGSRQRRNRPLAVAVGANYLLRETADEYRAFWTPRKNDRWVSGIQAVPSGQTAIASRLIDALQWKPDLVVIVSDGYENDPPLAAEQIASVYRAKIAGREAGMKPVEFVHANPVFDADHFAPRPLGKGIATVGLRDAEDLATMLGFARFASGNASLDEVERYLIYRMELMLGSRPQDKGTET